MESWGIYLAEIGYLPDALTRIGIRQRLAGVLNEQKKNSNEEELVAKMKYIQNLKTKSTIAIHTSTANKQHYEVPTEFFQLIMGKYLKYSCCWFDSNTKTLDEAGFDFCLKKIDLQTIFFSSFFFFPNSF